MSVASSAKTRSQVVPFLRWAGGKSRIVDILVQYTPKTSYRCYWEPFLGAAAMYFALKPKMARLSDSNGDLIHCYEQVRDHPRLIQRYLAQHLARTSKTYYYSVRDQYNKSQPSVAQAARFIYLNKTSFNGIFRVNEVGQYNVPYGYKEPPVLPSLEELKAVSSLLKRATLSAESFETVLSSQAIEPGDFIYLDPPYPPLNSTAYFTHYTPARFTMADQIKVSEFAKRLRDLGCFLMISNSDTEYIRDLYQGWEIHTLPVIRWIAANGTRHKATELVITSYPVKA